MAALERAEVSIRDDIGRELASPLCEGDECPADPGVTAAISRNEGREERVFAASRAAAFASSLMMALLGGRARDLFAIARRGLEGLEGGALSARFLFATRLGDLGGAARPPVTTVLTAEMMCS